MTDCDGHGTHVSGIVKQTAIGDAISSSAFCIMPLKFLGCDGVGSTSSAINAIDYAIDNGAKVLNNSWGNDAYSNALHEAVTRSYNAGAVFVAAAGNNASNNDITPFTQLIIQFLMSFQLLQRHSMMFLQVLFPIMVLPLFT